MELVILAIVVGYLLIHHRHYRRHRRMGFGVWYSLRGPWGTRVTVRKRLLLPACRAAWHRRARETVVRNSEIGRRDG